MGNTINVKGTDGIYVATIQETNLNRMGYSSIFELGDLENIKALYHTQQTPVKIHIYDSFTKTRLVELQYERVKNRTIVFVIQSKNRDVTIDVANKIRKITQWRLNKKLDDTKLRPRVSVKCPSPVYTNLKRKGWRTNCIYKLAYTERTADAKIVYLKNNQVMVISSNSVTANERIVNKFKNYKKLMKM
jgi:hypothetical protein